MRRLLHEIILRVKRHGAVLAAVGAIGQQEAGLVRIPELGIEDPLELFAQTRVINRTRDLHTAVEIARHEVGGGNIELCVTAASELINAAMLQKAPDDAGDVNILRFTGHTRQDAADAADDELGLHARAGRFCQFIDDLAFGDGIGLDADIAILAKRDLPIDFLQ